MNCEDATPQTAETQQGLRCKVCESELIRKPGCGRIPYYCGSKCRENSKTARYRNLKPYRIRLLIRSCMNCGNSMKPQWRKGGKAKRYCGSRCQRQANHNRKMREILKSRATTQHPRRDCRICLKTLNPNGERLHAGKFYCSRKCSSDARLIQSVCVICSEAYYHIPSGPSQSSGPSHTCSGKCRRVYQDRIKPSLTYRCEACNQAFQALKMKSRIYCSTKCRNSASTKKKALVRNTSWRLRQERLKAAKVEKISPCKVFSRDNWTCWICSQPIDRTQRHPEPLAATIDHVIPISKGGDHTYSNVRCAHSRCNSVKNSKIIGT